MTRTWIYFAALIFVLGVIFYSRSVATDSNGYEEFKKEVMR